MPQNTLTGILTRLFPRLAKIVVGGTITTNSDNSLYPTAISNEIMGGHHGLDTTVDLANIPNDRLHVPMLATVKSHTANNVLVPRKSYVLEVLPPSGYDRLSEVPNYILGDYWKDFSSKGDKGDRGDNGLNGDPTLSADLNAHTGVASSNNTPIGNGLSIDIASGSSSSLGGYSSITNSSNVTKIGMIKLEGTGYADGYNDSYIYITPEFSLNGVTSSPSNLYLLDNRSTIVFNGKSSSTFQYNRENFLTMFFFKVPANTTLYVGLIIQASVSNQSTILTGLKKTTILM